MFIAEKGSTKVLLDLAHYDEVIWSGGKYRSYQTYEIFGNDGYRISKIEDPPHPGKFNLLTWGVRAILKFGIYRPLSIMGLRMCGHTWYKFSWLIHHNPDISTYLIEGTGFGILQGVAGIKSLGKKVILCPINVESLFPHPGSWTHSLAPVDRLKVESKYYAMADAVFCISMEENWLLSILGARTFFLPYHPPGMLRERIEQRVRMRNATEKRGGFYYANFENYANYLGFEQFVRDKLYKGEKIRVAGLSAYKITPLTEGKEEFTVLGELSEQNLERELAQCEYVILNHYPTSGMLTRIPELLLSEILVHGNDAALKAYKMIPPAGSGVRAHLEKLADEGASKLLELVRTFSATHP